MSICRARGEGKGEGKGVGETALAAPGGRQRPLAPWRAGLGPAGGLPTGGSRRAGGLDACARTCHCATPLGASVAALDP